MVTGLRLRALNKLAYLIYSKRVTRNKRGNPITDWRKAEKILTFCKNRPNLIWRLINDWCNYISNIDNINDKLGVQRRR